MSLLLLPALPLPVKRSSWWAAYKHTVGQALKHLRPSSDLEIVRLDIAIVLRIPSSAAASTTARTAFFTQFQDILREVYTLVCVCAAEFKIDLDFPGGIDARVFFLERRLADTNPNLVGKQFFSGPIVDIHTFCEAQRPYRTIYSVESGSGDDALEVVLQSWRQKIPTPIVKRLPGGPSVAVSELDQSNIDDKKVYRRHKSVAVGGTFDHLHIGHKLLLAATAYMPQPDTSDSTPYKRTITIGITGDELLVNKKHGALVESWEERQQRTAEFVDSILVFHPEISTVRTVQETDQPGPNGKVVKVRYGKEVEINYTRISDPFGPTITEEDISALIISAETRAGGKAVNDKRIEKGWAGLEVFEVDVLDADVKEDHQGAAADDQTFSSKISSTEIRRRLEAKGKNQSGRL